MGRCVFPEVARQGFALGLTPFQLVSCGNDRHIGLVSAQRRVQLLHRILTLWVLLGCRDVLARGAARQGLWNEFFRSHTVIYEGRSL